MREEYIDSEIREMLGLAEVRITVRLPRVIQMVLRNRPDHVALTETDRVHLEGLAMAKVSNLHHKFSQEVKKIIDDLETEASPFGSRSPGSAQ